MQQKTIKETIKTLKVNNQDVDVLEFEPNLKPIKFNDITTMYIAQQEQINLKDRIRVGENLTVSYSKKVGISNQNTENPVAMAIRMP